MLNNSLYQTVRRDFDRRQAEQKHLQDLHIQEIYEKIPEYESLEQELISLCAHEARERVMNPGVDYSERAKKLHDHIESIRKKQQDLLANSGFPEDYPDLKYICDLQRYRI